MIARTLKTIIPLTIKILHTTLKFKNIFGNARIANTPMEITANVYMIRFTNYAAITVVAGIPSFIIKKALAGCPPDADGVIAEK